MQQALLLKYKSKYTVEIFLGNIHEKYSTENKYNFLQQQLVPCFQLQITLCTKNIPQECSTCISDTYL